LTEPDYNWEHSIIQRELDKQLQERHEQLYDLSRIPDQQAKAAYMAIDASVFMLIPRHKPLELDNEHLRYLARQLFGKPQRAYQARFCPNISSNGNTCHAQLDSRDIHVSTCRSTATRHIKHTELQDWLTDFAKEARIPITPPAQVVVPRNSERARADICLAGVSLRTNERDGVSGVLDVSIVHPAALSYCSRAARTPHYATKLKEDLKNTRYKEAYQQLDNSNFMPFVIENGGTFGVEANKVFKTICSLIARETGQCLSSIAHFWKSTLLVILARRAYQNSRFWAMAHNSRYPPPTDDLISTGCYDVNTREQRIILHNAGNYPISGASLEFDAMNPVVEDT
jgi:hypothetical protein